MNPERLRARCAHCGAEEALSAIAVGNGSCPICHRSFCDDDTMQFRLHAYRADVAYRLLIRSLRNLSKSSVAVPIPSEPLLGGVTAAVPGPTGRHA